MKYKKMSLGKGKRFALFSFLSLFAVYSPIIYAQDKNWLQISSAEFQSETLKVADTVFEAVRIAGSSEDSASKHNPGTEKFDRAGREKHGIIVASDAKATAEIDEFKFKTRYFAAPNIEPNDNKVFFSPKYTYDSFIHQSEIDLKVNARLKVNGLNYADANFSFAPQSVSANGFEKDSSDDSQPSDTQNGKHAEGFRWRPALQQAFLFLAVQHGYAMTQPKTREALKGKFFRDYVKSVKSLHGWEDGGRFFTNYIAHPMQGSFLGFIQIQNDPKGIKQRFGSSGDYWRSRMKAIAWSAAWSTQFEIGPISQASIGNVGLKGKQTYIDIVITPTLGTAMLVAEDALDRFVIERIERTTNNYYLTIFSRMLLNPTRTVANLIRFKLPWYRDRPRAK